MISLYGRSEVHTVHRIGKIQTKAKNPIKIEMNASLRFCLSRYFLFLTISALT